MVEDGKFDSDDYLGDEQAVIDGDLDLVVMLLTVDSREVERTIVTGFTVVFDGKIVEELFDSEVNGSYMCIKR